MRNLSDTWPLFCAPRWPSYHVSENQELQPHSQGLSSHCLQGQREKQGVVDRPSESYCFALSQEKMQKLGVSLLQVISQ